MEIKERETKRRKRINGGVMERRGSDMEEVLNEKREGGSGKRGSGEEKMEVKGRSWEMGGGYGRY